MKKVVAAGLPRHRTLKLIEIWRGKPKPVQISGKPLSSVRLCRPAVRKGSAFPAQLAHFLPLLAACPDSSGQAARRGWLLFSRLGKAEPFRTAGRQSRRSLVNGLAVIWTGLG